jgi:dihydropteroate synthase
MHMHREPVTMQTAPMTGDVVPQVMAFLKERVQALQSKGVGAARIALDVGTGFGKTPEQNFELLARHAAFESLGHPLLAGWSRKSSLGAVTGLDTAHRLAPSVAAAIIAVQQGARVVRVHDVRDTVAALKVWQAVEQFR